MTKKVAPAARFLFPNIDKPGDDRKAAAMMKGIAAISLFHGKPAVALLDEDVFDPRLIWGVAAETGASVQVADDFCVTLDDREFHPQPEPKEVPLHPQAPPSRAPRTEPGSEPGPGVQPGVQPGGAPEPGAE